MKTCFITGGSGDIGSAIVERLNSKGISCIIVDLKHPEKMNEMNHFIQLDLGDITINFEEIFEDIQEIHYLIHCASLMKLANFQEEQPENVNAMIQTNIMGVINLLHCLLPKLADNGRILFMSSAVVYKGNEKYSLYSAAKSAIDGFSKSLARELGSRGVTVNSVAPGFISTNLTKDIQDKEKYLIEQRAIKQPLLINDIVELIEFLMSENAKMITGQTIVIDGGVVFK